jgi:MFS family permease
MTQVVMESASVPRPIASSAYNMVRFCGGAIAPFVAGKLAEHVSVQAPFYLGAGMTAVGVGVLWLYRDALRPAAARFIAPPRRSTAPTITAPSHVIVVNPDAGALGRPTAPTAVPLRDAPHSTHGVSSSGR